MRALPLLGLTLSLLTFIACSGDPCENAADALCDKACACPSTDGRCYLIIDQSSGGQSTFSYTQSSCKMSMKFLSCGAFGGTPAPINWQACQDQLATAQCATLTNGNGQGLVTPRVCLEGPVDAGRRD